MKWRLKVFYGHAMSSTTMYKNKRILLIHICKTKRNNQYISNYCYWDKNKMFYNCFLKSEKDEILIIDNISLFYVDGVL